jgi:RNA polymerase sigma-70 factor (ECF subfamily)
VTSEHTLLERARAYDADALGELYDQYAPLIYAYLYRRVHDAQLAEDLTGEVFVRVLQAIQSEQFWHTSFRGWLYRIAHNLLVDHYRKQPPVPMLALDEQLVAAQGNPDSALAEKLSRQDLLAAISQLTLAQQQVLALRFGEQLAAREVAEVMGKSVGAVEVLQHRALTSLRRILRKKEQ